MNEHLLQYIWMHRLYDAKQLETTDRQPITVIHPGQLNKDQGPDFLHARIRINHVELIGSVEIHTHTSHWNNHGHTGDAHYNNVVLHVVWEHDVEFNLSIPVLILKGRVPSVLLTKYSNLSGENTKITCTALIGGVPELIVFNWKERMLAERLTMKAEGIQMMLSKVTQNAEEVFWQMIFRNMGLPVNADAFDSIFRSVSFRILLQCSQRIQVIEALLLGQAGLLEDTFENDYLSMLQKEYHYLQRKFGLNKPDLLLSYLRMRPAHFPVIRIVQLAMLIHTRPDLYSQIFLMKSVQEMRKILSVTTNDFWHHRYSLRQTSAFKEKKLGSRMADILLINTFLPFRYMLALRQKNQVEQTSVFEYYMQMNAERNAITDEWKRLGVSVKNALDAQALMHLRKNYCNLKRCLECAIGNHILKTE